MRKDAGNTNKPGTIVIEKKKISKTIIVILYSIGTLFFFIPSVSMLVENQFEYKYDIICALIFIALSIVLFVNIARLIKKLISSNPEFEINEKELIIYDNRNYNKIPFEDMIECKEYSVRYAILIGIKLKPDSSIKSNLTKLRRFNHNISKKDSNIVFIQSEFADIKAKELVKLINERIP